MSDYTITCMPFLSETQTTDGQWTVQVRNPNGGIEQTITINEGARSEQEALRVADELSIQYNSRPS